MANYQPKQTTFIAEFRNAVSELNRDCTRRENLQPEQARYCYLWAETQWLNAIESNDEKQQAYWGDIRASLAQLCSTLNK